MKTIPPIGLLGLWLFSAPAGAQTCNANMPEVTPSERFAVHDDGTVTDTRTGLMWKQCSEGQSGVDCAVSFADSFTWQEALERVDAATDAGYGDWRLPNIKELSSIVETKCYFPAINVSIFPNTPRDLFWSSSSSAVSSSFAWSVNFDNGYDEGNSRGNGFKVRMVRGGQ